jgi:hypothetical protein
MEERRYLIFLLIITGGDSLAEGRKRMPPGRANENSFSYRTRYSYCGPRRKGPDALEVHNSDRGKSNSSVGARIYVQNILTIRKFYNCG